MMTLAWLWSLSTTSNDNRGVLGYFSFTRADALVAVPFITDLGLDQPCFLLIRLLENSL